MHSVSFILLFHTKPYLAINDFMLASKTRHPISAARPRTVKTRCAELQLVREGEPSVLMEKEIVTLSDEERKSLYRRQTSQILQLTQLMYWLYKSAWLFPGTERGFLDSKTLHKI